MNALLRLLVGATKIPGFIASLTEAVRCALTGDAQGAERAFKRAIASAAAKKAYRS